MSTIQALNNKLQREIAARHSAEQLLENKSRELYQSNQALLSRNQKIAEQSAHLQLKVHELEQTRQQLVQSEKMAVIGQLTAGVAHEINNPVAFVASNLDTLRDYLAGLCDLIRQQKLCLSQFNIEDSMDYLKTNTLLEDLRGLSQKSDLDYLLPDIELLINESIEGTRRVGQIVADLSDFSYLNAPQASAEDLNILLQKTVKIASSELKYKADIDWQLGEIPKILCQAGKLGQVFLNLLLNAVQAIEGRGIIRLSSGQAGDWLWVEIADNGCGISADKLANIFDPFFTTKEIGKGTGLGLHVAKAAVEMHGGELAVTSAEGSGAAFKVVLPIAEVTRQ
jgi:signal transduction histidine kinase